MSNTNETVKKSKTVLDEQIKFIKLLKRKVSGDDIKESAVAVWTSCMLDTYIKHHLMFDVQEAIENYVKNKQN